jgi:hypothetical protein
VNWSALDIALVPPAEVTVISTVPAAPVGLGGLVARISESLITWKLADAVPNLTDVAMLNPLPFTDTVSPPSVAPLVGLIEDTVGRLAVPYVN